MVLSSPQKLLASNLFVSDKLSHNKLLLLYDWISYIKVNVKGGKIIYVMKFLLLVFNILLYQLTLSRLLLPSQKDTRVAMVAEKTLLVQRQLVLQGSGRQQSSYKNYYCQI